MEWKVEQRIPDRHGVAAHRPKKFKLQYPKKTKKVEEKLS
jgi:hypothetical protein